MSLYDSLTPSAWWHCEFDEFLELVFWESLVVVVRRELLQFGVELVDTLKVNPDTHIRGFSHVTTHVTLLIAEGLGRKHIGFKLINSSVEVIHRLVLVVVSLSRTD